MLKNTTVLSFVLLIAMAMGLSSCDAGRSKMSELKDKYAHVIKSDLDENNAKDAVTFAMALKVMAEAHAKENSGKEAAQILNGLQTKAAAKLKSLDAVAREKVKAHEAPLTRIMQQGTVLKKLANAADSLRFYPKVGACIVRSVGSEFSKDGDFTGIEIYKVVKLGKEEMIYQPMYQAAASDFSDPVHAAGQAYPEKTAYINLSFGATYDCAKAKAFSDDYKALLTKYAQDIGPLREQMVAMNTILSKNLF